MFKQISIRLPKKLSRSLNRVASLMNRPRSYLVRKAIEVYLEEYAEYQVALDRLRDKDDEVISSKELRKRFV